MFGNDTGKEFLHDYFKCNLRNYAISGAPLCTGIATKNIYAQFKAFINYSKGIDGNNDGKVDDHLSDANNTYYGINKNAKNIYRKRGTDFKEPDIILLDGGGNDYLHQDKCPTLGAVNHKYPLWGRNEDPDPATVCGALEAIMQLA